MELSLTINVDPKVSPLALRQWLDWAAQIDTGKPVATEFSNGNGAEPHRETVEVPDIGAVEVPEPVTAAPSVDEAPKGALPPGVGVIKGKPGRKPSQATLDRRAAEATQQAEAAASVQAVSAAVLAPQPQIASPLPASNGARPPGVSTVPQKPAMPPFVPEAGNGGIYTKADLDKVFSRVVGFDHRLAISAMQATKWADGTAKPVWYTTANVPEVAIDRLYGELAALLPAEG